jgi:hypothetical protein
MMFICQFYGVNTDSKSSYVNANVSVWSTLEICHWLLERKVGGLRSLLFVTWSVWAVKECLCLLSSLLTHELIQVWQTHIVQRKFERWKVMIIIAVKSVLWLTTMSYALLYLYTIKIEWYCSWRWVNCCHFIFIAYHACYVETSMSV